MDDQELLAELGRRLREYTGAQISYVEGVFVLHRWDGEVQDPPLRLHVGAEQLARFCRVDEGSANALWPDVPVQVAGLNLLLVHLEEVLAWALQSAPQRRHVVLEPRLAVLSDPAVLEEQDPPPPVLPQVPAGERGWCAYAPLTGESFPAGQPPSAAGVQAGDGQVGEDEDGELSR
ncbi:hypothetical protein [Kineococcus sp. SYSU DK005]|uniref:hypothetical protein n=1 Tax=Kineococcus sp. SYSU DK005 TaxID=3383126 RepID=UPI003D7C9D91